MEDMGEGVPAKDADIVLASGTSYLVAVQVYGVSEEVDSGIRCL